MFVQNFYSTFYHLLPTTRLKSTDGIIGHDIYIIPSYLLSHYHYQLVNFPMKVIFTL